MKLSPRQVVTGLTVLGGLGFIWLTLQVGRCFMAAFAATLEFFIKVVALLGGGWMEGHIFDYAADERACRALGEAQVLVMLAAVAFCGGLLWLWLLNRRERPTEKIAAPVHARPASTEPGPSSAADSSQPDLGSPDPTGRGRRRSAEWPYEWLDESPEKEG